MRLAGRIHFAGLTGVFLALAGCEEGQGLTGLNIGQPADPQPAIVERDREAPEVFSAEEPALWDGRPSLGGVWVAHPDVDLPQRVMIRNLENGQFVMGALFRRERENPGPALQVSSDAAAELGLLAGKPTPLSVVAIIREQVEVTPDAEVPVTDAGIEATELGDPLPAPDAPAPKPPPAADAPATRPVPRPAAATAAAATPAANAAAATAAATVEALAATPAAEPASGLANPFIQIGLFSVRENADQAMELLRNSGILPTIKPLTSSAGKEYWRVVVGPVTSAAERRQMIRRVRGLGFDDAYAVAD